MGCHAIFLVLSISIATSVSNQSGLHTFCFSRERSKKFKYGNKNFTASCGVYFPLFFQWTQGTQDGLIDVSWLVPGKSQFRTTIVLVIIHTL